MLEKGGTPVLLQELTSDWFMLSYAPKINWNLPLHPAEPARQFFFVDHQVLPQTQLQTILARVGVPSVEGAENAVEFAIGLLRLAAEVEHALMVQYLYAAFSVANDSAVDGINYREKILDVAIQEMGHLATVQNILILLGGPEAVYVQRDVMRQASAKNPIPFVLEPVSLAALAKYVAAEKPAAVPVDLAEKVDRLVKLAAESAGIDTHRVGAIYGILQSLFDTGEEILPELVRLPFNPRLTDADLRSKEEASAYQATREEWEVDEDSFLLIEASDCASARAAISQIAEQGEGLSNRSDSHFSEFLEMADAYEQGPLQAMVTNLPISPTLGAHGGEGGTLITHAYTALWGRVFSLQYSSLILTLHHSFVISRATQAELRNTLIKIARRAMRQIIGRLTEVLAGLPLTDADQAPLAGPPYDLDPEILQDGVPTSLVAQHLRILDELTNLYAAIRDTDEFRTGTDQPNYEATLRNLLSADNRLRQLFAAENS